MEDDFYKTWFVNGNDLKTVTLEIPRSIEEMLMPRSLITFVGAITRQEINGSDNKADSVQKANDHKTKSLRIRETSSTTTIRI
ncbi:hypothetical protein Tco_0322705 [Tanacetum coccineum]